MSLFILPASYLLFLEKPDILEFKRPERKASALTLPEGRSVSRELWVPAEGGSCSSQLSPLPSCQPALEAGGFRPAESAVQKCPKRPKY